MLHLFGSEPKNFWETIGREARIIVSDFVRRHANRKTLEDLRNGNASPFYSRLSAE